MAKGLIETGQAKHVLLLTSETYSKWIHPEDGAVRAIFGDAATATLVEAEETDRDGLRAFVFGTDGAGGGDIIVPAGGMRDPASTCAAFETVDAAGNKRTNYNLYMNGRSVITFAQEAVPRMLKKILENAGVKREEIDYYVFTRRIDLCWSPFNTNVSCRDCLFGTNRTFMEIQFQVRFHWHWKKYCRRSIRQHCKKLCPSVSGLVCHGRDV